MNSNESDKAGKYTSWPMKNKLRTPPLREIVQKGIICRKNGSAF
jgi:hypothetical protein